MKPTSRHPPDDLNPATSQKFAKSRPLAAQVGISSRTLRRWADAGLIGRHLVGRRTALYDIEEVIKFVRSSRVQ